MPLISQQIPNLVGGISEQPDVFRRSSQCEDSINTYNDPVTGVKKRTGSTHVAAVAGVVGPVWSRIERDSEEKYLVNIGDVVRVWDSLGVERTVSAPNGWSYLSGGQRFETISVADTTFVVNLDKIVRMSSALSTESTASGLIFVRAIDYEVTYTVTSNEPGFGSINYTAPATNPISVGTAAQSITDQLNSKSGFTAERLGGVIKYTAPATGLEVEAFSSSGEDLIIAIPGFTTNFGDLPKTAFEGVKVRVAGDPTTQVDDYYVVFDGENWVETVKGGIPFRFNKNTMPFALQRESDGTFTFDVFNWKDRESGDEESSPEPSFVDNPINNIFLERNRLGFLSDVNCILSESDGLSNFWRTTVTTLVDSDVIDLSGSGRTVDILYSSISVKDGVLLFSESGQFLLNAGEADILSPATAFITNISSYQTNIKVDPIRVGDSILFMTNRDDKSGVREYFYQSGRDFTQSASITNHVPFLLPNDFNSITGSSTENVVFFVAENSSTLYIYQFLFNGPEKIISAWGKWDFNGSVVKFATVFEDYLFLVIDRGDYVSIESVPLSNSFVQAPLVSEVCLDSISKSSEATPVFDSQSNTTTFTFNRPFPSTTLKAISFVSDPNLDLLRGDTIPIQSATTSTTQTSIVFSGDVTSLEFIVGVTYNFEYRFSTPYLQLDGGDVDIDSRIQIRNYTINVSNTGNCLFRVEYPSEDSNRDSVFIADILDWSTITDMSTLETSTGVVVDSVDYELGRAFPSLDLDNSYNLVTYSYRVPINCKNTGFTLVVVSDDWQPVRLSKASWEGMYYKRSQRV